MKKEFMELWIASGWVGVDMVYKSMRRVWGRLEKAGCEYTINIGGGDWIYISERVMFWELKYYRQMELLYSRHVMGSGSRKLRGFCRRWSR